MCHHNLHQKSYSEAFYYRYQLLANRKYWNFECEYLIRRYCQTFSAFTRFAGFPKEGILATILGHVPFMNCKPFPVPSPSLPRSPLLELNLTSWYSDLEEGYDLMWQDIAGIKMDAEKHGINFMIFAIPQMEIVYDDIWDEVSKADDYERDKVKQKINLSTKKHCMKSIPVLDNFLSIDQQQSLYLQFDGHLNASGCNYVAEILFNDLKKRYPEQLP